VFYLFIYFYYFISGNVRPFVRSTRGKCKSWTCVGCKIFIFYLFIYSFLAFAQQGSRGVRANGEQGAKAGIKVVDFFISKSFLQIDFNYARPFEHQYAPYSEINLICLYVHLTAFIYGNKTTCKYAVCVKTKECLCKDGDTSQSFKYNLAKWRALT
jgi:hypothetical protein